MARPDDLWQFWDDAKAELARVPADAERTPAPEHSSDFALAYHVSLRSVGDTPIKGWLVAPPVPDGARLAGLLWLPGYGGLGEVDLAIQWAHRGFVTLMLLPRGQGPEPFPDGAEGKIVSGITDPAEYAYRSVFLDCLRGFEFLQSQPDVHPHRVAIGGGSQGGGLALATAALTDGRAAAVAAHVPFLCGYEWVLRHQIDSGPYTGLKEFVEENPAILETAGETLQYFDPVNLAEQIACPVYLSSGGKDAVCPPPTIRMVFDSLPGVKALHHDPDLSHEWREDSAQHMQRWLGHYLS